MVMVKFCFFGAESTGKSTMARKMAELYETEFVPEVAREMISSNDFTVDDIIQIGKAQTQRVLEKMNGDNEILFCDTDLITTQIYSLRYLRIVPPILRELELEVQYDHYFLFDIDVPWIADGLRDLVNERQEMHQRFIAALEERAITYTTVSGDWDERLRIIRDKVESILKNKG